MIFMYYPCVSPKADEDKYRCLMISTLTEISPVIKDIDKLLVLSIKDVHLSLLKLGFLVSGLDLAKSYCDLAKDSNKTYSREARCSENTWYFKIEEAIEVVKILDITNKAKLKYSVDLLLSVVQKRVI